MRIVKPSTEIVSPVHGELMMRRIELAGRTCYKSECKVTPGSAAEFVAKILRLGHDSVLEHESISVRFICDRGVSHEIVRHRIASYSQESTRYCDYGKEGEIQVIQPPGLDGDPFNLWWVAMEQAETCYNRLRSTGVSPQIARSVLPNSLKTELVMTANLREWRHFFKLRCSPAAHPQMREVAVPLLREFQRVLPVVFGDLYPVETTSMGGVPCQS